MEECCRRLGKTARNPQRRPGQSLRGRPARADEGNGDGSRRPFSALWDKTATGPSPSRLLRGSGGGGGGSGGGRGAEEVFGDGVGGDDGSPRDLNAGGDLRVLADGRDAGAFQGLLGGLRGLADARVAADPDDLVDDGALDP